MNRAVMHLWQDDGILREIWAPAFRETWTQLDPERENRKLFPRNERPDLELPWSVKQAKLSEY